MSIVVSTHGNSTPRNDGRPQPSRAMENVRKENVEGRQLELDDSG